ncbi:MAG TPA: ribonuclease HII [Stellaceae bacterium]|jgi:ribonuclease HII|nr:ribonuclease HII [Stellaceae bacterium]
MPSFRFERALEGAVCGVDEVGRAPLAGPVLAAAVILPAKLPRLLRYGIDDSKIVPREKREEYAERLFEIAQIGIGAASVAEIDTINILRATFLAMARAVKALSAVIGAVPAWALVDGNQAPKLPCQVQTIVGGDGKSLSIAAASIVAKVTRDRAMRALAARYPGYGWETNVGYPTRVHRAAILSLGVTPHHRQKFVKLQLPLELESNAAD